MSTTILIVAAVLVAFFVLTRVMGGSRISGEEARTKVAAGALLVDVRSPGEFSSGHIDGAKNIPHTAVQGRLAEFEPKEQEIVLYCASGMRSSTAARVLRSNGFENVHNLGPQSAW